MDGDSELGRATVYGLVIGGLVTVCWLLVRVLQDWALQLVVGG
jgi:hypothetical protein